MVLARTFDLKAVSLQRTGRLGTYAIRSDRRRSQSASPAPCARRTFFFRLIATMPRCFGAASRWRRSCSSGAAMSAATYGPVPPDFPFCIPVGSQAHAAGVAYAFKFRKQARVAVCLFGDGATSKGDVWEAMNFAGVYKLPVVFVVNNNQWAISVPLKLQTASETLAQKAIASGFAGEQVDGDDVIAVRAAAGRRSLSARGQGAALSRPSPIGSATTPPRTMPRAIGRPRKCRRTGRRSRSRG